MKKLLLLLAVLCGTVSGWAQNVVTSTEANPKYYVIASYNRGGYLTNAGVGSGLTHVALSDAGYWYFEKANDNGGVYIVNKVKDGESKVYVGSDKTASTTSAVWYVLENGVNKKGFSISSTNPISGSSCIDANNYNTGVGSWNPSASDWQGTTWVVCSTEDNTYNPGNLIFRTRSDRYVESISLESSMSAATPGNSTTINRDFTGDNGLAYIDLTGSVTMRAVAGETVTASIARNGSWTNAYVYIDKEADGFTASYDTEAKTLGEDLMTFSFYSGDEADDTEGVNSAGDELATSARNTIVMPSFQAPSTTGTYRMRFKHDWNSIDPNGGNANFNSNGGSIIDVTLEVVSSTIEVKYSFTWEGVEKFTQTAAAIVGEEYPEITTTFPFGVSATKPEGTISDEGIVDGVKTVEIALSVNLPFEYAPDVASIEKWQYIQMHSNFKRFLKYESNYISWSEADANLPELGKTDAYAWTFVGNPFDGFKMLNKAATTEKALKSTNSGNPTMANYAEATTFLAAASNQTGTGYFCMRYPGGNYLNAQNGKVNHWSDNDAGSTMVVDGYFVEMTLAEYLEDLQTLISNAEEFVTTNDANKSKVGYCKLTDIQAQIDNAKDYTESESMVDVDNAFLGLQNVMNNPEVNLPVDGKFYRIENNNASGYLSSGTGTGITQFVAGIGEQASSIFCYTGGKLLSYTTGLYLAKTANNMLGYTDTVGEAAGTTIGFAKSPVLGKLLISFDNGNRSFYSDAVGNSNGAGAGQKGEHYRFTVTEVETLPFTFKEAGLGYATFNAPVAVEIPEGVKAYVGEIQQDGTTLQMWRIENGVIPANTAVLLYNSAVAEENVTVNLNIDADNEEADAIKGKNSFVGTVAAENLDAEKNCYSLQVNSSDENKVGFYNKTTGTKGGFKGWLETYKEQGVRTFTVIFDGDNATGIKEALGLENENVEIYDLSGRRLDKPAHGVNIIGGKTVIVR